MMIVSIIDGVDILGCGLLTGAMSWIWIEEQPRQMPAAFYIERQQRRIPIATAVMPRLGAVITGLTLTLAICRHDEGGMLALLIPALLCQVAAALITARGNMPINRQMLAWQADQPPAEWQAIGQRWMHWHRLRTGCMAIAFAFVTIAALVPGGA